MKITHGYFQMIDDLYKSIVRSKGDLGAFLEVDPECAYLYILALGDLQKGVTAAVPIWIGPNALSDSDICLKISKNDDFVGVFIRKRLIAAYDFETMRASVYPGAFDHLRDLENEFSENLE